MDRTKLSRQDRGMMRKVDAPHFSALAAALLLVFGAVAAGPARADDDAAASMPASDGEHAPASQPAVDEPGPASMPASQPAAASGDGAASQPASRSPATQPPADTANGSENAPVNDDSAVVVVAQAESADAETSSGFLDIFRSARPVPGAGTFADRPGFSDSAMILPSGAGTISVGVGAAATTSDTLLLRAGKVTVPDVRLRFGVFGVLEAEAGLIYDLVAPTEFEAIAPGRVSAATLGGRILIVEEEGFWPSASVLVRFYLPTQTLVFDETGLEARGLFQKTFLDRVTFGGNAGFTYFGTDEQLSGLGSGFVSVGLGLGLSVFAQGIVQSAIMLPVEFNPNVQVEGGGAYAVSDWLQLDLSTNVELLPTLGSWSVSAGATMYFPGHLWGIGQ